MKDADIVNLFWERNERALQETERAYGRLCFNISFHILRNHEDAEECVNDAYLQTWNSIPPQRPRSLKKGRKKHRILYPVLIAAALCLCGFGYKLYSIIGAGYTKDIDQNRLAVPFDTSASSKDTHSAKTEKKNTSGVDIRNINDVFAEKFKRIDVDSHQIDSLYFSPEYMLIFSNQGESWTKEDGQTLCLNIQLEDDQSLYLGCGYIDNGEYYELTLSKGNTFSFSIKMKEGHEYYLCVTNYSSENAVIKKGTIAYE